MGAAPKYTCAVCGLGVAVIGEEKIRGCIHVDAPIRAAASATVAGKSGMAVLVGKRG